MIAKVFIGDSRDMKEIDDGMVQLIVTSPPYWQLKDYGSENQIGFGQEYSAYINSLNKVWEECHRVLHDGCRLCINIGEQLTQVNIYGRYKVMPMRDDIVVACEKVGFDFMGAIIWQKISSCHADSMVMGSYPYPRNGVLRLDYEYILIFRKLGDPPIVSEDRKERSKLTADEWNKCHAGHWNFPGVRQDVHQAMFPYELPKRLIKMYSFVDDVILDPFLGSGTTMQAAIDLGRNALGYEINKDFKPVINEKIGAMFGVEFIDTVSVGHEGYLDDLKVKFDRRDNISRLRQELKRIKKPTSKLLDIEGDYF